MRLSEHRYSSISMIKGPLLFVERVFSVRAGEVVRVRYPDGREADGEVLRVEGSQVLIQLFGVTQGLDTETSSVIFTDSVKRLPLSVGMIGRVFSGSCIPLDGMPMIVPEAWAPVTGYPMNPVSRACPTEFIETGFSALDGLNTLVRGQKLPIFSSAGLPSKEVVAAFLKNARLSGREQGGFVVIFVALGLTHHEYSFYISALREVRTDFIVFANMAEDPAMQRLLAPRYGLTAAEYLAFEKGRDVLVIITDMTNYCDALREVSTSREELPGRRGYPGYLYSDLASLYERAGRIRGIEGSVTLLPVLTMPEDDITHPVPDLTGYITEGQIVLSRDLHRKGIFPPIDVLPSLSRLMQAGIGAKHTREDHRTMANQLYKYYARGRDLRKLEAIVGREGMGKSDRHMLDFADSFERDFVHQGMQRRTISDTLESGWRLLKQFTLE